MSDTDHNPERPSSVLAEGSRIGGDYEVDSVIKAGGMGEVYRAHNIHLGSPCAIKVVLPGLESDPLVKDAFLKEATTLQSLHHDAIVRYFNFTLDAGLKRYCLIMELVEGTPLSDFAHGSAMDVSSVLALMRRLAKGLLATHKAGVVHRDLSPDNVILPSGSVTQAKIIDFGIAKTTKAGSGTLFQDKMVGKFGYMAPEQLGEFDARIGPHTDIYSLGLMMAAVSQGEPLAMGGNYAEAFRARQAVPVLDGVPAVLDPLLDWMLQPNPMDRPASMAQVIDGIDRITAENAAELTPVPQDDDMTVVQSLPPRDLTPRPVTARKTRPGTDDPTVVKSASVTKKTALKKSAGGMGWIAPVAVLAVLGAGVGGFLVLNPDMNPLSTGETAAAVPVDPTPTPTPDVVEQASGVDNSANENDTGDETPEIEVAVLPPKPTPVAPEAEPTQTVPDQGEVLPDVAPDTEPAPDHVIVEPEPAPQPEPMELDTVSTMLNWIKDYDAGECTYTAINSISETQVNLLAYGQDPTPFLSLISEFRTTHQIEPDVTFQTITAAQCAVLDYVNWQNSEGAPSTDLDLADDTVTSGSKVSGTLTGLDGRNVWLALIDPNGGMVNLERFLQRKDDEEATFSIGLSLREGQQAAPHMILALVSDSDLGFTGDLQNAAPADQVLAAVKLRMLVGGSTGAAVVRYFRLE